MNHPRRAMRLAVAAVTAGAVAVLTACAPVMTQEPYAASDGLRVELGDHVVVQNLLVVSAAEGAPGAVQGAILNTGAAEATVVLFDTEVSVDPGQTVLLGGTTGEPLVVDAVEAAPGATLPVELGVDGSSTQVVPVPVLDGTLPEYADLVPAPLP